METAVASTSGRMVVTANFVSSRCRRRRQGCCCTLSTPHTSLRRSLSVLSPFEERPKSTLVARAAPGGQVTSWGGGGRDSISSGVQPSLSSLTPSMSSTSTATTSSSPSPLAAAAAAAVLALAAAWAASSFARERGAVSSSASAAGLRGGDSRRGRGKKKKKGNKGLAFLGLGLGDAASAAAAATAATTSSLLPDRTYRAALSVTRRSVALTRAVQAADFGNIAAALTELDRALAEHVAAGGRWGSGEEGEREGGERGEEPTTPPQPPLPSGTGDDDMRRLYVLHLQNSDLPAIPEDLEPMRSLLRIGAEEAAEVEAEVLSQSGGFSI